MKVSRIKHDNIPEAKPKADRVKRRYHVKRKDSDTRNESSFTDLLNIPGRFSYADYNRNKGAIEMFRHQVNQAISNYGVDLQYFRKYNSFFQEGEKNTANYIYGEDTTAEFYASGMIRAYVSIENMAWSFNQIGFEGTEQINIFLSIDNFEQTFQDRIGKVSKKKFEIPVSGTTITNEVTGLIVTPEFEATVYAQFSEDDMEVHHSEIKVIPKEITRNFYLSRTYQENNSNISGDLEGLLFYDKEKPFNVNGILSGELKYHNLENIENSETWQHLAPQVGDYFKFKVDSGIDEEWEISNVYDKLLTKSGLNPFLGKYVYQVSAVRRLASYEKNTDELEAKEPGEDINEILGNLSKPEKTIEADQYTTTKRGKNKANKKTNKLGKNVYDWTDKADEEYGGIQNQPNAK